MQTQIYEVAIPAEAEAISAIGVDHLGVLGDGAFPRELPVQKASECRGQRLPTTRASTWISISSALLGGYDEPEILPSSSC